MTEESFVLYEWSGNMEDYDDEEIVELSTAKIELFQSRYNAAKAAKVKEVVYCPTCNKRHLKTTYHNIFCENPKCKDTYWNAISDNRRERAKIYK